VSDSTANTNVVARVFKPKNIKRYGIKYNFRRRISIFVPVISELLMGMHIRGNRTGAVKE